MSDYCCLLQTIFSRHVSGYQSDSKYHHADSQTAGLELHIIRTGPVESNTVNTTE